MDKGLTISEIVELSFIAVIVIIQIVVLINTWLHIERYKKFISDDDTLKLKSYFVPGYKLRSLSVEDVQGNEIYLSRIPSDKGANGEYSQFVDTGEVPDLGGAMREEDAVPQAIKDEWAEEDNTNSPILSRGTSKGYDGTISFSNVPVSEEDAVFKIIPGNKSGDTQYGRFEPYLHTKEKIMKFYRSKRMYADSCEILVLSGMTTRCSVIKSGTIKKNGNSDKWMLVDKCQISITIE